MKIFAWLLFAFGHSSFAAPPANILKWHEFKSLEEELPVVDMQVNGHKVRAFFDTGANGIILGEKSAQRLGLLSSSSLKKSTGVFAGGKTSETLTVDPVTLTVGNQEFERFPVKIVKGADASSWRDITVGIELLKRARILMDYRQKTMTVLNESELSKNKKSVQLPIEFVNQTHLLMVRALINGKESFLHFDTSGTFALNLLSQEVKRWDLKIEKRVEGGRGGGGQAVAKLVYKPMVKVCLSGVCESVQPISIEGQEAMWTPVIQLFGKDIAGQISHQFLRGKKVEYDLAQNRIWILAD